MIDHRTLHGMQRAVLAGKMLDGDELLAVEGGDEHNAAVDRAEADAAVAVPFRERDRAGAAIALGAAFLGAAQAFVIAEVLQHRSGRVRARQSPRLLSKQKSNCGAQLTKSCSSVGHPA